MARYNNDPRVITAKFDSICNETGKEIKKGDKCLYYPIGKSVFSLESEQYYEYKMMAADWDMGYNY
jgi:hypothetical protein